MESKQLIILRGPSGSGKSTFAHSLSSHVFEADNFHMKDGKYQFDVTKLGEAHKQCQDATDSAMSLGLTPIVVSNTNTRRRELEPYLAMAKKHGYTVTVLVVEPWTHPGQNVHNVPPHVLKSQKERFEYYYGK